MRYFAFSHTMALVGDISSKAMVQKCLAMFTLSACLSAAQPAGYDLELVVEGVRNTRGDIGVLVFNSPEGWPERVSSAFTKMAVPARVPVTILTIHNLPAGQYGVVVLHDENSNTKLDRNRLGNPKEQWGMSNNPRAILSAPSFSSARFSLNSNKQLHVKLR